MQLVKQESREDEAGEEGQGESTTTKTTRKQEGALARSQKEDESTFRTPRKQGQQQRGGQKKLAGATPMYQQPGATVAFSCAQVRFEAVAVAAAAAAADGNGAAAVALRRRRWLEALRTEEGLADTLSAASVQGPEMEQDGLLKRSRAQKVGFGEAQLLPQYSSKLTPLPASPPSRPAL